MYSRPIPRSGANPQRVPAEKQRATNELGPPFKRSREGRSARQRRNTFKDNGPQNPMSDRISSLLTAPRSKDYTVAVPVLAASSCSVASSTRPWYCYPNSTPLHRSGTLTFLPYVAAHNHPVSFSAPAMLPCSSRSVHCIPEKRSPTNSNLPQYNAQQARSPPCNPSDPPVHQELHAHNRPCTSPTSKGNAESAPESIQTHRSTTIISTFFVWLRSRTLLRTRA